MRIVPSKIKKFLEKPDILSGVLICGTDHSMVNIFVGKIIVNLSEYSVHLMDFSVVNNSPGLLFSELVNISLFTKRRLIKLINVSGIISKELRNVLDHNVGDHYVIMIANDLPYSSTTKSYMEESKIFGVITCRTEDSSNLCDIISSYLKQNDIECTSEIIHYLQFYFSLSKLPIYSALEKLILYLGRRKDLRLDDIDLCFLSSGNGYATLDNLCSAIVSKDTRQFIKISDLLMLEDNFPPATLIRIISNYFLRLESVLLLIKNGMNEQAALEQLRPRLFFKQSLTFKSHLKCFQLPELKSILRNLMNLEIICKRTDLDHKMVFQHGIIISVISSQGKKIRERTAKTCIKADTP